MKQIEFLTPFCWWRNWGSKRQGDLLKVPHLVKDKSGQCPQGHLELTMPKPACYLCLTHGGKSLCPPASGTCLPAANPAITHLFPWTPPQSATSSRSFCLQHGALSLSTIFIITSLGGTTIHAAASSMLPWPPASWLPDHPRLSNDPASARGCPREWTVTTTGSSLNSLRSRQVTSWWNLSVPLCPNPSIAWWHPRFPTSKLLSLLVPLPRTSASPPECIKPLFILDLGQVPPLPQSL